MFPKPRRHEADVAETKASEVRRRRRDRLLRRRAMVRDATISRALLSAFDDADSTTTTERFQSLLTRLDVLPAPDVSGER
jgi:hypothetical protein